MKLTLVEMRNIHNHRGDKERFSVLQGLAVGLGVEGVANGIPQNVEGQDQDDEGHPRDEEVGGICSVVLHRVPQHDAP